MKNKIRKNKKGFSIGEVVLAIFVLNVAILSIMLLFSKGIQEFRDERNSVVASMLAQEGVEMARNIRDNTWADRKCVKKSECPSDFPETFDRFTNSPALCRIDIKSDEIKSSDCDNDQSKKVLYINSSDGFYDYDNSGEKTDFKRAIKLDRGVEDDLTVTSFATWDNTNIPNNKSNCNVQNKCVFSEITLSDWGTGS